MNKVYRIRHIKTGEFYCTGKQKDMWFQVNHAKSAWCQWENRGRWGKDKIYFDQQTEYEIVPYVLVEEKEYNKYKEWADKNVMDRLGFKVY